MLCPAPHRPVLPAPDAGAGSTERPGGFTLVEVLMVSVIVGILTSLATPRFQEALEDARMARAIGDLRAVEVDIQEHMVANHQLPETLAEVGRGELLDPWGNPYRYLRLDDGSTGQARKDRFLVPLNTDFDLYSVGPNGESRPPLNAKASVDDVIRANDGGYVGPASQY